MKMLGSIPAMPVSSIETAVRFYTEKLGFSAQFIVDGAAGLTRDAVSVHLWEAGDERWRTYSGLAERPVRSGAESFIAGTASCRIEVDDVDALYSEFAGAMVLHPTDAGSAINTEWGTREFATLDLEGNLLTFFSTR